MSLTKISAAFKMSAISNWLSRFSFHSICRINSTKGKWFLISTCFFYINIKWTFLDPLLHLVSQHEIFTGFSLPPPTYKPHGMYGRSLSGLVCRCVNLTGANTVFWLLCVHTNSSLLKNIITLWQVISAANALSLKFPCLANICLTYTGRKIENNLLL